MADCKLQIIDGKLKSSNARIKKNNSFTHFKIHTQYSICEGAIKIDNLKDFCKANKVKALGISDSFNLCGALEFF